VPSAAGAFHSKVTLVTPRWTWRCVGGPSRLWPGAAEADGLDGAPIDAILAEEGDAVHVAAQATDGSDEGVYSADEEAGILERLRDLGYE